MGTYIDGAQAQAEEIFAGRKFREGDIDAFFETATDRFVQVPWTVGLIQAWKEHSVHNAMR